MAKYYVTGVWKNTNGVITHIQVNAPVTSGVLRPYAKWTVAQGVQFLGTAGNQLSSATWSYQATNWKEGEKIIVVNQTLKYLRTAPDNTVRDNLDNLLPMNDLVG